MTRRTLLPAVAVLASLWGAGTAIAQSQPPPPTSSAPVAVPPAPPPLGATPTAPSTPTPPVPGLDSWAEPSSARLVADGSWPELADADLSRDATRGDLDRAIAILTAQPTASPDPSAPLRTWTARAAVIRALGLQAEMLGVSRMFVDGGPPLRLPRHAATETLARELGFVVNQPSSRDDRERSRAEVMRLADLVFMLERARAAAPWQLSALARYREVRLPAMNPARFAVVQAAVAQIGQPYVWAGDWPGRRSPWGPQGHGGFDCSGLVWWAFKGSAEPRRMALGADLLGRTADAMAFERPAERTPAAALAPGDLVFFGSGGPTSPPGSIGHTGIALGNGWMIHSSGSRGGVTISHLDSYWPSATAFGRRVAALGA